MIMKSDINKIVCILFVHLSSISLENFKDRSLNNLEILELIKLHTYKFGLVYILTRSKFISQPYSNSRNIMRTPTGTVLVLDYLLILVYPDFTVLVKS